MKKPKNTGFVPGAFWWDLACWSIVVGRDSADRYTTEQWHTSWNLWLDHLGLHMVVGS